MQAQSMRLVRILGDVGYFPNLLMAIAKQYAFVGLPKPETIIATDQNVPVTFQMGKFNTGDREIQIDLLHLYPAGLAVTTRTNTNDSDRILDDLLAWAS